MLKNINFNTKLSIAIALVLLTAIFTLSCKKNEVQKVKLDNHLALALYSDNISFNELITDMDSTTNSWLRMRNDSIFVFYVDTLKNVLKASDLLGSLGDMSFNTNTTFTMPEYEPTENTDTVVGVDKFMSVPFSYDGYNIKNVLIRSGELSFDFQVTPTDLYQHVGWLELFSNQILSPQGDTLKIRIDFTRSGQTIDLAGYQIVPENDSVSFGASVALHVESGIYEGGEYECHLEGGLSNISFYNIYGTIEKPFDTVFSDIQPIDFGISGLTGSAILPMPTIDIDYRNTFGLGAIGNITKLRLVNTRTGLSTNLLGSDMVEVVVNPTNGAWDSLRIEGLVQDIDALAGYTRLDFAGRVMMNLDSGSDFSLSDTSTVDIAANIEMPMSIKISELQYNDTIAVDFSGGDETADQIDDYVNQMEIFIDYNSKIKLNMGLQAIFIKDDMVLDSLFNAASSINYSPTDEISTISVRVDGAKLRNVLNSNNMILRVAASTDGISSEPVTMLTTDDIFLRMRVITTTSEIDITNNN